MLGWRFTISICARGVWSAFACYTTAEVLARMLRELAAYLKVLLPVALLATAGAIGAWFWWQHHPHATQPDSHWQEKLVAAPPAQTPETPIPPANTAQSTTERHDNNSEPLEADGVGRSYTGYYPLHGRMLPLQPGSWTVLAEDVSRRPEANLKTVLLGQIVARELMGAVMFTDSQSLRPTWPSRYIGCTDRYNLASHLKDSDPTRQACWTIRPLYASAWKRWRDRAAQMNPIFRAAAAEMDIRGVDIPQDLLEVAFHTADMHGALNAVYYFNPTDDGLTSNTVSMWLRSDWSVVNITRYPEKVAYEKRLEAWGQEWWEKINTAAALPRL